MCGLCGEITFDGSPASAGRIQAMCDAMAPRGPDGAGVLARGRFGFGHRRLKIIDLSEAAAQPFTDTALGFTIVFNGCIYNYKELRAELQALGHVFASHGDTEVILKAWAQWGPEAVPRLQGMFAFAIHERDSGRLVLVRDRFGIKPLYLAATAECLRFASTLPALLAAGGVDTSIDRDGAAPLHDLARGGAAAAHHPRRRPQAAARDDPHGRTGRQPTDHTYWTPPFERSPEDLRRPAEEWRDRCSRRCAWRCAAGWSPTCRSACCSRAASIPRLIVGLLAEAGQDRSRRRFSIGFEAAHGEKGDEFHYSDLIAGTIATDHHQIFIPSEEMRAHLPDTIAAMSEPMVCYDNIGFYLLSPRGGQARQGGAVRPGRRRGLRRLSLVPAARAVE